MEALQRYRWRGNIRELRNAVERLLIMTPGDVVRAEDLPREICAASRRAPRPVAAAAADASAAAAERTTPSAPAGAGTLASSRTPSERAFLVQKLRENDWNISKTAEVIDTPRSNLYKKLEQYRHQAGSRRVGHARLLRRRSVVRRAAFAVADLLGALVADADAT